MNRLSKKDLMLSTRKLALLDHLIQKEGISCADSHGIPRRKDPANAQLSFAQERLWFIDRLERDNPVYNEHFAIHFNGKINLVAFEASVNEVVRRHEILRTAIGGEIDCPAQLIAPSLTFSLPVVEMSHLSTATWRAEAERLAVEQARRTFDLSTVPLLRLTVLRFGSERSLLLLTIHHIISDGWSIGILLKELALIYESFCAGKTLALADLPIQYGDYAQWHRKWVESEVLASQLSYWERKLSGSQPLLELPTDRPRPLTQAYQGARRHFKFSPSLARAMKDLCQTHGVTLFMGLLAAFKILLFRYTRSEDLIVGIPVAGRARSELEGLIGCFINMVALRTSVSGKMSVQDLLEVVKQTAIDAYRHQEVPFEKIVESLRVERHLGYTPLFQAAFVSQETLIPEAFADLGMSLMDVDSRTAKFDLTVLLRENEQDLHGWLEYNTNLFDSTTVGRIAENFRVLLEEMTLRPQRSIADLAILTDIERHLLLNEWNEIGPVAQGQSCLHELFEEQAERNPDAIALVFGAASLTYHELNERANQLAHYLELLGVKPEVRVGIHLERSVEMVICLLATLKSGGAYVPLDPQYPRARVALMLEDAHIEVLLTKKTLAHLHPEHNLRVIYLDESLSEIRAQRRENLGVKSLPGHIAYIIYTSGSTGRPKGVAIEHHSAVTMVKWALEEYSQRELDGVLASTSICFDLSVYEIFAPLGGKGKIILVENVLDLPHAESNRRVSLINTVPSAMMELLRMRAVPESVVTVNLAGEPLPQELAHQIYALGHVKRVINLYGPTEDTTYSTVEVVERHSAEIPSIGRPIADTQVYILEGHSQLACVGGKGELYISGMGLARGYLNQPGATAEKFLPNPFNQRNGGRMYGAGDLARRRADGRIEFLGRMDGQIKLRGFRIELGEIEAALRKHPALTDVVVVIKQQKGGESRLVAYVVGSRTITTEELKNFLKRNLPHYMVPSAFVTMDGLPLTPNGKVDRRALPEPQSPQLYGESALPRTPVEEILAGIWGDVLGCENPGAEDNFFDLGGHSLSATQVISRAQAAFLLEIPLRRLFEYPTIRDLGRHISDLQNQPSDRSASAPIRLVDRQIPHSLSYPQRRLWFLQQLMPESCAYNLVGGMKMEGKASEVVLEQVIWEIIRRHEILRTKIEERRGEPIQIIASSKRRAISLVDVSAVKDREELVRRLGHEEKNRKFDLSQEEKMRVNVISCGVMEKVVIISMHHIASDGWSLGVLSDEVGKIYQDYRRGEPSVMEELKIQYVDFAVWQTERMESGRLDEQIRYWDERLKGIPQYLELPISRSRAATPTSTGHSQSKLFSADLTRSLKSLCRQEGVTLFMLLLSAFQTLLHRYKGQEDIAVGIDIANRNRKEFESLIGLFVNQLVLRTDFSGDPTFRGLLARVREATLGAFMNQDVPFDKLVEHICPQRDPGRNPLFQVMFIVQNAPMKPVALPELTLTPVILEEMTSAFDLTISVEETGDEQLKVVARYFMDLFDDTTIARMLDHLEVLSGDVIRRPLARLSQLEYRAESEKHKIVVEKADRRQVRLKGLLGAVPKAVNLDQHQLIEILPLLDRSTAPLLIQPLVAHLDLPTWASTNAKLIETHLLKHGALLFRGFNIPSIQVFQDFAQAISPELLQYGERSSPRTLITGAVYTSTDHPADQNILLHNEQSYTNNWPMKIMFHCARPAEERGETPIADSRKIYERLDPRIIEGFRAKGIMYVRNYGDGLGLPWQEVFQSDDKWAVEQHCGKSSIGWQWKDNDRLRTVQVRPAIRQHPKTGENVWFNHGLFFHVTSLAPEIHRSLVTGLAEEDLPCNTYYGDGTPIEPTVLDEIRNAYLGEKIIFEWRKGDILVLDNMLMAHGREPFRGARKIAVIMAEPFQP